MFIVVLSKRWKQLKCPPTDEWLNDMLHFHMIDSYSAIDWNGVLIYVHIDEP